MGPQFGLKIGRGRGAAPRTPPLDPPLLLSPTPGENFPLCLWVRSDFLPFWSVMGQGSTQIFPTTSPTLAFLTDSTLTADWLGFFFTIYTDSALINNNNNSLLIVSRLSEGRLRGRGAKVLGHSSKDGSGIGRLYQQPTTTLTTPWKIRSTPLRLVWIISSIRRLWMSFFQRLNRFDGKAFRFFLFQVYERKKEPQVRHTEWMINLEVFLVKLLF